MKYYPLAGPYSYDKVMGLLGNKKKRGKLTGEFRSPKKGEWYLSGAIPECYQAPHDLTNPFHIVKIVEMETITIEREVKER
jgi:protocatechuate 3,4-dioxygenase beta subunit